MTSFNDEHSARHVRTYTCINSINNIERRDIILRDEAKQSVGRVFTCVGRSTRKHGREENINQPRQTNFSTNERTTDQSVDRPTDRPQQTDDQNRSRDSNEEQNKRKCYDLFLGFSYEKFFRPRVGATADRSTGEGNAYVR